MTRARSLPHPGVAVAVALLAAALLAGFLAVVPHAKASTNDVIIAQSFRADSANKAAGDTCPMGSTSGTLGWQPGLRTLVAVSGTVADHPLPGDTSTVCGEDGRFSTVTFAAWSAAGVRLDTKSQTADNSQQRVSTYLKAAEAIALVTVQVCRNPGETFPFSYCGPRKEYRAPVTSTPTR